ncbi:MAG: SprT family zinc-dependent metalloprotease [Bacteroidales bacterium]|nr:SprT family zinc-dependent metalloprotease [Bacteroidales bacterium]
MVKIYNHPQFGEIRIKRVKLSNRVKIAVHPLKGITVTIPWLVSYSRALKFIEEKREWISETIKKQSRKTRDEAIRIGTESPLKLITKKIVVENLSENNYNDEIISEIRKEAKIYLPERVRILAETLGFNPGKVTVRNNRTNWGSCSKSGNISLNIHLMRLTPELADFVIIHELCHLKHRNHGPQFHNMLNSLCDGRERELNKMLRKERPQIMILLGEQTKKGTN